MASTVDNLYMISDTFSKGIEVLGILRNQLLKEMEKNRCLPDYMKSKEIE